MRGELFLILAEVCRLWSALEFKGHFQNGLVPISRRKYSSTNSLFDDGQLWKGPKLNADIAAFSEGSLWWGAFVLMTFSKTWEIS